MPVPVAVRSKASAAVEPENTSWQTPDKDVEIKNITVYVSVYSETDTTGILSPPIPV